MALLAWTGCASPAGKFTWQKDSATDGQLRRVLVAYSNQDNFGLLEADFSDRLAKRLTEALNQRGVPAEAVRMDSKALDPLASVVVAAARFRPEQILRFGVTELVGSSLCRFAGRNQTSATLVFTLEETPKRKVMWRATGKFLALPLPEEAADEFLQELTAAGLL